MAQDIVLKTHGLTKGFKGFAAASGVNLCVQRGSTHALIGPSGTGETICFSLLTKFLVPTCDTILFNGVDITSEEPAQIAYRGVIRSFQISVVLPHLMVMENVRVRLQRQFGMVCMLWRSEQSLNTLDTRAMELLGQVGLTEFAHTVTVELPYGRKHALEIAITLAVESELILLDEPTQGMGHEDIDRTTELIKCVAQGRTILMIKHNMNVISPITDKITVLQYDQILAEGPYKDVSKDPQVVGAYMGAADAALEGY